MDPGGGGGGIGAPLKTMAVHGIRKPTQFFHKVVEFWYSEIQAVRSPILASNPKSYFCHAITATQANTQSHNCRHMAGDTASKIHSPVKKVMSVFTNPKQEFTDSYEYATTTRTLEFRVRIGRELERHSGSPSKQNTNFRVATPLGNYNI